MAAIENKCQIFRLGRKLPQYRREFALVDVRHFPIRIPAVVRDDTVHLGLGRAFSQFANPRTMSAVVDHHDVVLARLFNQILKGLKDSGAGSLFVLQPFDVPGRELEFPDEEILHLAHIVYAPVQVPKDVVLILIDPDQEGQLFRRGLKASHANQTTESSRGQAQRVSGAN